MNYDKSPEPKGRFVSSVNPDRAIDTDAQGNLQYRTGAASGHVEVILPSLPGSAFAEERLHVKDFGAHVAGKIESSMKRQGYLRSGPQQSAPQVLRHYVASARGAKLMDEGGLKQMETLAGEFAAEPDRAEFYSMVGKPYQHGLTPKRRQP